MDFSSGGAYITAGNYTATPPPPPPKPSSGNQTPSQGPPFTPGPEAIGSPAANIAYKQRPAYQHVAPPEPGWLPAVLNNLSYVTVHFLLKKSRLTSGRTQDLQHLLEHPELQIALLDNPETSHPSISQAQLPLKQVLESNIALSENLTALESQLTAQRSSTQSRLLGLRALEQQHRGKISETETELRGFSPMALYQRLNANAQEQDLLLRGIEDSFVEENGMATDREVQDFIRRVREAKKVSFLRNERKLRWDEGRVGGWR